MRHIKQQLLPIERLTREPGHYFFGYYDLQPWSADGRFHLCHRVDFRDRMPTEADPAELGIIPMNGEQQFIPFARTYAWNFQQGAMLQWHPLHGDSEVIFNTRIGNEFKAVIRNIWSGEERLLSRAVANVDPLGRWALSINFSRLHDFRPGYGYAGIVDPFYNEKHPEDDGVFLVNLQDGSSRLIISYRDIVDFFKEHEWLRDAKILINHITFNNDGTRFVFLVRTFPTPQTRGWKTAVLTANTDGSDLRCLIDFGMASHYWWRDPDHILFWAGVGEPAVNGLFLINDATGEAEMIDPEYFVHDGHCSHSPDGKRILYDGYPDRDGYRRLFVYDINRKRGVTLATVRSEPTGRLFSVDLRCDLHPRWNRNGSAISFDSMHEGHRHVYWIDLTDLDELFG
ncbi:MAG: hypothetical protein GX162_09650 [Firmicutes bacterium]|jgi:hypothetical protein|nr:hypothetical protein [Bacillota bacterium]